ncbi:conserved hypothetical protein [Candidatus Propionivibrio aalborgensis]|uniref:Uncharacterized protein n=1 Tax=Candidatus Propionivibrio aalborgensis TaxID=1860101 RepID=A0A1A8XST0_9RHOO|nr:conserved hypothetical protein [Candidatus Propionivibrio aalborgensis]
MAALVSDGFGRENSHWGMLAEWTGLEPATPGVTGRYSNQLNYHSNTSRSRVAAFHARQPLPILGVPTGIRTPVPTVKG